MAGTRAPTTSPSTDVAKKRGDLEHRPHPSALAESTPFDYAPAPESREIVSIRPRYGLFIGGDFVEPKSGTWFETIDPATEERLSEVAEAGPEDVDRAVAAARNASESSWGALP